MQIIRYLNGQRLRGAMPPLTLDCDAVSSLLSQARLRQDLPLPASSCSAILDAEDSDFRKDIS
ncbi:hypothetical protein [Agathobaculum sp.]|uniref:hypothetical protein n=1 Tax=Agathobaculum sp. TaxID=2048138 RepID=UPI002A83CEF8|nr:hypothetical protein [Agathobaculum sp.]MDY3617483.1 hypothetical protein [Agathobaculum sp.]